MSELGEMLALFGQSVFVIALLKGMVRIATPVLLAALGELVTERSGILNLGIEGIMLTGALTGFLATYSSGSLWVGLLAAAASGIVMGALMAFMASTLRLDQVVSGLALNLLASGITFYWFRVAFKDVGTQNLPNVKIFEAIRIPLLSQIPILGEVLFNQHFLTYLAVVLVAGIWFFLHKTRLGLQVRSTGENPRAVDMKGLSVGWHQYGATCFGGMMAALGGSFLTLASAGMFIPEIQSGRGWIAIALVIFGNWIPHRILLGALFFGLIDSWQIQMQAYGFRLPYQLLLALPYLLTILALVTARGRSREPLSLGVPYSRE
jgi:simple sugar transport system permease protein